MSQEDIRFHITKLDGVKEEKLQQAFDMRLHGALIHVYYASPQARTRQQKRFKVGRLSIPPEMVSKKKAFQDAVNNPGKKYKLSVGPYDVVIALYKEFETREMKLKNENDDLRKRVADLERALGALQKEKNESNALLAHVLDSKTPAPIDKKAVESSRNPRGPGKPRPNQKRHPKRSPVHKRMKVPVKTMAICKDNDESLLDFSENMIQEKPLQQRMEYVVQRLQNRLPEFLQHMHDHG